MAQTLSTSEVNRLKKACNALLALKKGRWVYEKNYCGRGNPNGRIEEINGNKLLIEFADGKEHLISTNKVRLGHDPKYQLSRKCTFIDNLMWTALDFQMDVDVVDKAIKYFQDNHSIRTLIALERLMSRYPDTKNGNRELARELWDNNHRTRAAFLRSLVRAFRERKIDSQKALQAWLEPIRNKTAEEVNRFYRDNVRGQIRRTFPKPPDKDRTLTHSVGPVLFDWLRMRCGHDGIKADLRVRKFVSNAVGRNINAMVAADALVTLCKATQMCRPFEIDSLIWQEQGRA